ncbi:hypothetical protein ACQP2F_30625 [Actinoplanes sp. CA-030573]|uniref:hypothetical protein n=1 Tax=Actinoplanes sp. CA-030573 TaxID=3239898 RepID=UPI003D8BE54F
MSMRRVAPATALFFISPLVAEFLLGDFTLAQLPFLVLLAPAYGGAAVLVREIARRTGRGWPTMLLLALAYGVIEEGLETQSLFNPHYLGLDLLAPAFVPALGISVSWTLFVLAIHTIWSISTPIALVEEWTTRRTTPWLRLPGLIAAAVLITVAFLVPATRAADASGKAAPAAWVVGIVALTVGVVLMLVDPLPAYAGVVIVPAAFATTITVVWRWSNRPGWDGRHRLALAGGALLTYVWHSFTMNPVVPASAALRVGSHVVFALVAVVLLVLEARRVRARETRPEMAAAVA